MAKPFAQLKTLDHDHQQLRGAGPMPYEEALEAENRDLKKTVKRMTNGARAFREWLRMNNYFQALDAYDTILPEGKP